MCGIFATLSRSLDAVKVTLSHLKQLEYRGYDSAGIGVLHDKQFIISKNVGATDQLHVDHLPDHSNTAISHVRWATHGVVNTKNAHPHLGNEACIVHNGIIENHHELIQSYQLKPKSDTDSEVIVLLYEQLKTLGKSPLETLKHTVSLLKGSWAIVLIDKTLPETLLIAVNKSPLVLGTCEDSYFVASDPHALAHCAKQVHYVNDHQVLQISLQSQTVLDELKWQALPVNTSNTSLEMDFYLTQEIYEQPLVLQRCLKEVLPELSKPQQIVFVASGSSYHSALMAAINFEAIANIPCRVFLSSELKYMKISWQSNTVLIALSQSGETADTLEAVRHWKHDAFYVLSICNVMESSLTRLTQYSIVTPAGPEVSVGATKTVSSAAFQLHRLAFQWANIEKPLDFEKNIAHTKLALTLHNSIKKLAQRFVDCEHLYVLGRGCFYPVVMEFALKVKELCYLHAEAFSTGELKHGPLALIEDGTQIIFLCFKKLNFEKTLSNIEEVLARGGEATIITDTSLPVMTRPVNTLKLPFEIEENDVYGVLTCLQLFSLELAIAKGINPDRPRNLAKCVTVE